jgi:competence protein ComEC
VSFQLSFAAVLSLLLIGKWMQGHVIIRGKIPQYLGGLLIVALAAQLGTMPLSLYYFGQTSNYFALTNLIVVPAAFVLLLLGFTSIAFSWCVIGEWLGELTQCFTHCLRLFVEWIEGLPFSTMHLELSAGSVSLLYVAIACALLMMRKEKVKWAWLLGVKGCLVGVLIFENRNAIFS